MAHWKVQYSSSRKVILDDPTHFLDRVALISIAAAPGLFLTMTIPLQLVLPAVSILSFTVACGIALYAHCSSPYRSESDKVLWELAYAFAFVWVAAGICSNPWHLLDWFESLAVTAS